MPHPVILLCSAILCAAPGMAFGQEEAAPAPATETAADAETARIMAAIDAYVAAFNARDAEKLVSLWSEEGVYLTSSTGEAVVGSEAMAEEFAAIFSAEDAPKLAVETESIEFISPNVALERGRAMLTRAEEVVETTYRAVFVKRGDAWLVDRVTEDDVLADDTRYEKLSQLEWLLGNWAVAGEGFSVEISCQWTKNGNFLSREYVISVDGRDESSGLQVIGWDANRDQIVSWLFDSDGGVVTGEWRQSGDEWFITSVVTLADGGSGSFTSVCRPLDENSYAWRKVHQFLDGELLPNIDEIVLERQ